VGLPSIRLHDLRHSYATAALAAGIPAKVVSERLGHATIAITMDTYSHSANNCIASKDTGYPNRRVGKSRIMSTFQDVANDVSVPASVPA
jgi:integrase